MKPRLYEKYVSEVVPALKQKRGYANIHLIPKLEKIVVNMGVSASLTQEYRKFQAPRKHPDRLPGDTSP